MKSLEIKNYKNFEELMLNDLAGINLIVGKNNVGKSALLEVISIFASNGDLEYIKSILDSRGESVRFSSSENLAEKELDRFLSLYHDRDLQAFFDYPIEISADKTDRLSNEKERFTMRLVEYVESTETDSDGFERPYKRILDKDERSAIENLDTHVGLLLTHADRKMLYAFNGTRRNLTECSTPCEYVRTNQIMGDKNPSLFDRIALTPNEKYIIEALKIIEPQIENINFLKDDKVYGRLSDERVPFVVFPSSAKRYRLSAMGDGINRILTIILAILNCKNGILLIDEFENGLHYSVQYELWKVIFRLSEQLNVQVFATTHSIDTLRGLSRLISEYSAEEMKNKIACYYLQYTQDGAINSYRYGADNIEFLIAKGEEIR
jgi:AAA15 family ATPase/GTPase